MLAALLAALLATSLAIFSFGMHPARYVRLQRALGPGQGQIEPCTDRQAERVAERLQDKGVSSWRCKGWKQGGGAHERWHITSTDIHPASFPKLGRVIFGTSGTLSPSTVSAGRVSSSEAPRPTP